MILPQKEERNRVERREEQGPRVSWDSLEPHSLLHLPFFSVPLFLFEFREWNEEDREQTGKDVN